MPGRPASDTNILAEGIAELLFFIDDKLGWSQTFDFAQNCLEVQYFGQPESAAGEIEPCDAKPVVCGKYRGNQVIPVLSQQGFVRQGTGCNDASDFALDRAFAGGWVAHLFTDCHRLTLTHELGEVAFHGVVGHTGHRNGIAARFSARCQCDIQEF